MAKRSSGSRSTRSAPLVSSAVRRTLLFLTLAVTGVVLAVGLALPGRGLIADVLRDLVAPWFGTGRWLLPIILITTGLWIERRAAHASRPLLRLALGLVGVVALQAIIEVLAPDHGGLIGKLAGAGAAQMLTPIGALAAWVAMLIGVGLVLNDALVRRIFALLFQGARSGAQVAQRGAEELAAIRERAIEQRAQEAAARAANAAAVPAPSSRENFPSEPPEHALLVDEEPPVLPISATFAPPRTQSTSGAPEEGIRSGTPLRGSAVAPQGQALPTVAGPIAWRVPGYDLLATRVAAASGAGMDHARNKEIIRAKLASFGIVATVEKQSAGPVVTQYEVEPDASVRLSRIEALSDDLAMALSARSIRIQAPIPGRSVVGIEIPNREGVVVDLKSVFETREMAGPDARLMFALGQDVAGESVATDLAKMPHLLIAGATGSGKSVMVNALIASLLFHNRPTELKLILVDPKRVELSGYNGLPHLLVPVITEAEKASSALKWAVLEMEQRYRLFAEAGARNIEAYNEGRIDELDRLPFIVIVIDELADLMMQDGRETEEPIVRIAQKARATGIHMVLATQRPSVNVVTGLIKANIPSRIAFSMASQIDSRTVLDAPGAEDLIGRGDMLFQPSDMPKPIRLQGVFVSDAEIAAVVEHWRAQGLPDYQLAILEGIAPSRSGANGSSAGGSADDRDRLFDEAVAVIREHDRASASLLQRRLRIGYARAARVIDQLEAAGYIGAFDGSNARVVNQNALQGGSTDQEASKASDT